ncbi:hypothetical protein CASFOL_015519 [Castilleja foliolosa]|uniref:Exonuclease domain-containing protein n=1 Tax=Castilleja foliolosa TaxID=1961234 RepID=A0ABD3DDZ1_9LAMI
MAITGDDKSEIAFFDVETTVPTQTVQGRAILEFGAILVCPRKLVELGSYSTLVRPADQSHITSLSARSNGITKEAVLSAPTFADIADIVYDLLHDTSSGDRNFSEDAGRIWAGHNILRFDCARIREAYAEISKPAPEPKGTIDSLELLTKKFGRRAGNMKMASLAKYFGLGPQTHRSLDDVRMNLEVVKYCATVLFLESSLPDIEKTMHNESTPSSSFNIENHSKLPTPHNTIEEIHPIVSLMTPNTGELDLPPVEPNSDQPQSLKSSTVVGSNDFLEPDFISIPSISVTLVPFYRGTQKIQILHQNFPLQLQCVHLKVRFGIRAKFTDHAGRPQLNFVVDASPSLCKVLDATDSLAQKLSVDSGSSSEWRPVVLNRKPGFFYSPTVRLHLPTVTDGEITRWATEIYQKDSSATQRLVFSRFDVIELENLFAPGNIVDACFSLDVYDYQQNAGIRLVAKKLTVHLS